MDTFKPTHLIAWRMAGTSQDEAYRVALFEGCAYSPEEWAAAAPAWVEYSDEDGWLFGGQPTPNGANGEVTVYPLDGVCQWSLEDGGECGQQLTHYRWSAMDGSVAPCCAEHAEVSLSQNALSVPLPI